MTRQAPLAEWAAPGFDAPLQFGPPRRDGCSQTILAAAPCLSRPNSPAPSGSRPGPSGPATVRDGPVDTNPATPTPHSRQSDRSHRLNSRPPPVVVEHFLTEVALRGVRQKSTR